MINNQNSNWQPSVPSLPWHKTTKKGFVHITFEIESNIIGSNSTSCNITSNKYSTLLQQLNKYLAMYDTSLLKYIYYIPFARSKVLLWNVLFQNPCNSYANMHRNRFCFLHCDWLDGHDSTILIPHHSVSRSPELSLPKDVFVPWNWMWHYQTPIVTS